MVVMPDGSENTTGTDATLFAVFGNEPMHFFFLKKLGFILWLEREVQVLFFLTLSRIVR